MISTDIAAQKLLITTTSTDYLNEKIEVTLIREFPPQSNRLILENQRSQYVKFYINLSSCANEEIKLSVDPNSFHFIMLNYTTTEQWETILLDQMMITTSIGLPNNTCPINDYKLYKDSGGTVGFHEPEFIKITGSSL
jgi:hypothetical protein